MIPNSLQGNELRVCVANFVSLIIYWCMGSYAGHFCSVTCTLEVFLNDMRYVKL